MEFNINIIEDDEEIARIEEIALKKEGYLVARFSCGKDFLASFKTSCPDLVILDLMLPDISGMEILKVIRQSGSSSNIEVMIVSAKGLVSDKVTGLDLGADDYLEKPFSILELVSRVNARLRKKRNAKSAFTFSGFTLDENAHTLIDKNGSLIQTTPKEFELLLLMAKNEGLPCSRDFLFESLFGSKEVETRSLDVHIASLRKKLYDSEGKIIETVYGVGYRLVL